MAVSSALLQYHGSHGGQCSSEFLYNQSLNSIWIWVSRDQGGILSIQKKRLQTTEKKGWTRTWPISDRMIGLDTKSLSSVRIGRKQSFNELLREYLVTRSEIIQKRQEYAKFCRNQEQKNWTFHTYTSIQSGDHFSWDQCLQMGTSGDLKSYRNSRNHE